MIIVLMGVTGSGKTTVGKLLAAELGWSYYDADDFHSPANVEKMKRGVALDDADRQPWLETLRKLIPDCIERS
jgi:gluconokinase